MNSKTILRAQKIMIYEGLSIALRNLYLIVVLGDFNAQTKGWYPLGKTPYEGTRIDGITSEFGLEWLIHEPTHITGQESLCIDLLLAL